MITLPFKPSGKWSVGHMLDMLVDFVDTRCMDFNQAMYARGSKKPVVLMSHDTDANFGSLVAIVPISDGLVTTYYFVTTSNTFTWDATTSAFTKLTTSSMPTLGFDSDGVSFKGIPHVSGSGVIASWAGAWTSRVSSLGTTYAHPLCVSEHQNYLAHGYGNTIQLYDTSYSLITACTIPSEYVVTSIRWRNSNLYIGTRNIAGNSAKLFVWNGSGTAAQSAWDVKADWIYSMVDALSSMVVLTSTGQLLRFNGGGFDELDSFPVYKLGLSWEINSSLANAYGRCGNRAMAARGDRIFININGGINASQMDTPNFISEQPSGLWCYEKDIGLYHKAGYCTTKYRTETLTVASSIVTFSSAHQLKTGDPVYLTSTTSLTGITSPRLYFAIVQDTLTIKLAVSRSAALLSVAVPITGSSVAATCIIDTYDTMGATYSQTFPGAVQLFVTDNPPAILGSEVMFGGTVTKSDGTTTISAVMSLGASRSVSSFTTTPMPSSELTDNYQKLALFIQNLWTDDAEMILKWRTVKRYGFPTQYRADDTGLATWTADNQFTLDASAKAFIGAVEGDEVQIIEGAGAGYSAHISALIAPQGGSTYTVTLDEHIPQISAAQKSEVIVDNWKKAPTMVNNGIDKVKQQALKLTTGDMGSRIQYKVEMRGYNIGVSKLASISSPNEKLA